MRPEEIELALAGESDRVEWKQSGRDVGAVLQAVCALANDLGGSGAAGYLVLGTDDQGRVVGEDASDAALQRLASRLTSTKILPNPSCSPEATKREARDLVVVRVEPYPVPPVVKVDGVPWVRVGTTTRRATEADLVRLQERRPEGRLPFDFRPCRSAALEDLDLGFLRVQHAAERDRHADAETFPEFERWLAQHDLARRVEQGWRPNAAALLVHGVDPQAHFPGAILEFARYAGADFDAPLVTRKTVTGRLPDQLDALWAQLQANVADVPVEPSGIRTPYAPEYPIEALKELARNLVQHRLYEGTNAPGRISWMDDRIVFNNPGGPFGQANEGEFGDHSDYRNPTITRLLVELGYVERLGRGVRRVRSALASNGNPPLEFESDGFTTLVVRRRA